jgi:hypothetical protein
MGTATAVIFFRPLPLAHLRVKSAVGVSRSRHEGALDDMIFDDRQLGATAAFGVAYDLPLVPNLSLSPGFNLGVHGLRTGHLLEPSLYMWQLAVGLTWH